MPLLTQEFKTHMAQQFVESFDESANTLYYAFTAKTTPFEDEINVPEPDNSIVNGFYAIHDDMIFAKHIKKSDVSMMVRNVQWEAGSVYDRYDDNDPNIYAKNFYVISKEPGDIYSVFKCLENGSNDTSIPPKAVFDQPLSSETSVDDEYYRTADGYVWKLMCSMPKTTFEKFATEDYAPIVVDTNVAKAAKPGSIETFIVNSGGSTYNSYAFGNIKEAVVGGDPKIMSIQTDSTVDVLTFDISITGGTFVEQQAANVQKKVFFRKQDGSVWMENGVAVAATVLTVNSTIVRVNLPSAFRFPIDVNRIYQTTDNLSTGIQSAGGDIVDIRRDLTPTLSANTDFYKNNSIYIRSGRGAGQIRTITEYIVTGNERRVLVDDEFEIEPDSTSRFEISPRVFVTGDGTGSGGTGSAKAFAVVDPASNTISAVEVIDGGCDYTYASVLVQGNTGFIDVTSGAKVQADDASVRVVISPPGGHGSDIYRELGSNVVGISTTFNGDEGGKLPVQNDYRTIGVIKDPLLANTEIEISQSALTFIDGEIVEQVSDGATAEVSNRSGTTLRLRNIRGFFKTGEEITTKRDSLNITATINSVDRTADILDQRLKLSVEVSNPGPQGTGFLLDELVTQPDSNATGYVYSVSPTRIDLVGVKGIWNVSDDVSGNISEMLGSKSNSVAKVTGKIEGDITHNSGKIIYIENVPAISRADNQNENIKIALEF
jgi:hypothetical protein